MLEILKEITGSSWNCLSFAVDAKMFSPFPHFPERHINVLNVGRVSELTHRSLIKAQSKSNFYYVYDTVASKKFIDAREHRLYFANTAKRSRFAITNLALFDKAHRTDGAEELGQRFYESAAAGAANDARNPLRQRRLRQSGGELSSSSGVEQWRRWAMVGSSHERRYGPQSATISSVCLAVGSGSLGWHV